MVNTLQFNLSVPTAYVFMNRFLKAAQSDKKVTMNLLANTKLSLREMITLIVTSTDNFRVYLDQVELLSFFMTELCLVEYETLRFPPSMLAAAAIFTAQCTLSVSKEWTKTCEKYSNYTRDQLLLVSIYLLSSFAKMIYSSRMLEETPLNVYGPFIFTGSAQN